jgi:hypothetical protein
LRSPYALSTRPTPVAKWLPQDLGAEWKSKTWVISKSITGVGQYVVEFQYQHGASRLDFKKSALLKGNDVIAHDDHAGYSGKENFKNIYRLKVDGLRSNRDLFPTR